VVVKSGTLKEKQWVAVGSNFGMINKIFNHGGVRLERAHTSAAVSLAILGLKKVESLSAGSYVYQVSTKHIAEKMARASSALRNMARLKEEESNQHMHATTVNKSNAQDSSSAGKINDSSVAIIVKACDQGGLEAVLSWIESFNANKRQLWRDALDEERYADDVTRDNRRGIITSDGRLLVSKPLTVIRKGVGHITASDIGIANVSKGFIFGFNTSMPPSVEAVGASHGIVYRERRIVYQLFQDMEDLYDFHFGQDYILKEIGRMRVFTAGTYNVVSNKGTVSQVVFGVKVASGDVTNKHLIQIRRKREIIASDLSIRSMKLRDKFVTELKVGNEAGVILTSTVEVEQGDEMIAYEKLPRPHLYGIVAKKQFLE